MKVKDVPQDHDPSYEGLTKLCYALDDNGRFVPTSTDGWHVEETVKSLAWRMIEKDLSQTRALVRAGQASPLLYFMKARLMDQTLLAQNVGISTWRLKWHLRPGVFKKLSEPWLKKYAACLEITVDLLRDYKGDDGVELK
jgi:hypothetical protein